MSRSRGLVVLALATGAHSYMTPAPSSALSRTAAVSDRAACTLALRMAEKKKKESEMGMQDMQQQLSSFLGGLLVATSVLLPLEAHAGFQLPPIDKTDPNRCEFKNSAMGQSNAAKDKLYDLRQCDMSGKDAKGYDIAGAIMLEGNFKGVNFKEVTMSKVLAQKAIFDGADFSNAVMDRGTYKGSSFKGAVLTNAVLSGSDFTDADLTDTDFSDTYMGDFDSKNLCKNPTLQGENPVTGADTRASAACKVGSGTEKKN